MNPQREACPEGTRPEAALFDDYTPLKGTWDGYFDSAGAVRPDNAAIARHFDALGRAPFRERQALAERAFLEGGITFSVYSDTQGVEKIFPFDLIPRVVTAERWAQLERGLVQRVEALNAFLLDVYNAQRIIEAGIVPRQLIESSKGYLRPVIGVTPPGGSAIAVAGVDLIQEPDGRFVVLEDNLRVPSGVSYVLENRAIMQQVMPELCGDIGLQPVQDYPIQLREALQSLSPRGEDRAPCVVVLTPGPYNSAYFEHGFLARSMGCPLVQPEDLFVQDEVVYVRTTAGPQRVDVIYRRVDDEFIDPEVFRPDSLLGVPGLFGAWRAGHVALGNALGNGVADDKATYPYVPDMIRFYLDEEPIIDQIKTWRCDRPDELAHVLAHLPEMVVKAVDASGGYGMLMGPQASDEELAAFAQKLRDNPRGYIAQPRIELSTAPTWVEGRVVPRRVDLRPFVVRGQRGCWVLPGGLSRVALQAGSYVVNSSQGGGSKDTWVLRGGSV